MLTDDELAEWSVDIFLMSATASLSFDELFFLSISTLRPSLPMTPACQVFSSGVTALKLANMQITGFCNSGCCLVQLCHEIIILETIPIPGLRTGAKLEA